MKTIIKVEMARKMFQERKKPYLILEKKEYFGRLWL